MCKLGPSRVRKGLYFPAIAAIRFNPSLQPLARRLKAAGKPPMLIIGAAMRKLVHLAFGVLKSRRAYDADPREGLTLNTVSPVPSVADDAARCRTSLIATSVLKPVLAF